MGEPLLLKTNFDKLEVGQEIYQLAERLYPICRSITGAGTRQTLNIIQEFVPLTINEVRSGTPVFDWTVPREWNIRDAYVKNSRGEKIVDFKQHNLHVMNYSVPVRQRMGLAELKAHLFSLPDQPELIPYRTTYYRETWGFCLTQRQLENLPEDDYEVCIDSTLEDGSLTYGEYYLKGASSEEVLISTHICHPSLANDNLSGIGIAAALAQKLQNYQLRYSYRFVFVPGTIGSISWLALNEAKTPLIKHGLVLTGLGDGGGLTYKKSRRATTEIDRVAAQVLKQSGQAYRIIDFFPYGYDERQYCSPGFNLAVGRLTRTPHGEYPEYHTSGDNLDFIKPIQLGDALEKILTIIETLENNRTYLNLSPKGEPQLGKRGLYRAIGGQADAGKLELGMLWVLNLTDGTHSLLDIAEQSGLNFEIVAKVAATLEQHELLKEITR